MKAMITRPERLIEPMMIMFIAGSGNGYSQWVKIKSEYVSFLLCL